MDVVGIVALGCGRNAFHRSDTMKKADYEVLLPGSVGRCSERQEQEFQNSAPLKNVAEMTVPTRKARINTTTVRAA